MSVTIKRFIERDYMYNFIKKRSLYLTEQHIESILDEHDWCDLTFRFIQREHGMKVIITNNDTECDVALADLSPAAHDFYMKEMSKLAISKAQKAIKEIREILYA